MGTRLGPRQRITFGLLEEGTPDSQFGTSCVGPATLFLNPAQQAR